ncbi:MAG: hypothetical protein JSS00_06255 [Proteobacteria bacterium]|nr:hypothetical protein [Pseudomonadota bacterium]
MAKTEIEFLSGFDAVCPVPPEVRAAGLSYRFAVIQHTYRPDSVNMVFDVPLCRCLLEFVADFAPDVEVQPERGQAPKTSVTGFIAKLLAQEVDDQVPPALVFARRDGKIVLCMASEEWAQVGGPEPYHDSYTYSLFTHQDIGSRVKALLATHSEAEGWRLAEVEVASSQTAEEFFAKRRARAKSGRFEELLRRVPNRTPMPGDEID